MFDFSVFLRGVTWLRDSHGLFDYESKSITKKSYKTAMQSMIVRVNDDIEIVAADRNAQEEKPNSQTLLQIKRE